MFVAGACPFVFLHFVYHSYMLSTFPKNIRIELNNNLIIIDKTKYDFSEIWGIDIFEHENGVFLKIQQSAVNFIANREILYKPDITIEEIKEKVSSSSKVSVILEEKIS